MKQKIKKLSGEIIPYDNHYLCNKTIEKLNEVIDYLNSDLESKNTSVKDIDVPKKDEELREKINFCVSHYNIAKNSDLVDWLVNVFNNEIKKVILNCLPKLHEEDVKDYYNGFAEYEDEFKSNLKDKYKIEI